jgi:two-component system, cell cycle sensor histidine kinase and response regulator CckA
MDGYRSLPQNLWATLVASSTNQIASHVMSDSNMRTPGVTAFGPASGPALASITRGSSPQSRLFDGGLFSASPLAPLRGGASFLAILAIVLAGGLCALAMLASRSSEPLVLTVMGLLATIGVFFLLGLAAGHFRITDRMTEGDLVGAVTANIGVGVLITGRNGRVVFSNPMFAKLTGSNRLGLMRTLDEALAEEPAAAEVLFRLTRAVERSESLAEEFQLRSGPDRGVRLWFRLAVRPLPSGSAGDGAEQLALWELTDISAARVREAETARVRETTLRHFDSMAAGLLVVDAHGAVDYVNATLSQWLGLDADRHNAIPRAGSSGASASGIKLADIAASDGAALLREIAREPVERRLDLDLVQEDGRSWPARLAVSPRVGLDGAVNGFAAVIMNRSVEIAASDAPQSSDIRFARLFQSAPFGIALVNSDGCIAHANAAFSRLMLASNAVEGATALDVLTKGAAPELNEALTAALAAALGGKASIAPLEVTVGKAQEFTRRIAFSALARGAAKTKAAREAAILYVMDATEQKALEANFAQSQKMEAVGKLAGGIAHDFNNVLTAIIGFSDLLLQTHRPSDAPYKNIMAIKSSANRAADMVSQLLAFSRRQTLQPRVLQLGETLTDLSVMLNRLLGEKIDLKIIQGRDLWYVKADPTQLTQVMINLAVNAGDAMPDGGKLSIRTRNISERESQKVDGPGFSVGEYVMIEVEDNGSGMPADVMAKIFEPFFTTKGIGKGTGLGLSTVYGIVKQTGGFVFPESQIGKGTTFRVYLPRHVADPAEELAAQKTAKKERTKDLTGTGRVLLVEDEDAVRGFAVEALKRQGYEVLQACSGADALDVLAADNGKIDIVVSDVIMPEMDGPTLLKHLRRDQPDLKFIFMSGYPDDAFKNTLEPDTEFAFLQKPFSLAQLATKVKEQLSR